MPLTLTFLGQSGFLFSDGEHRLCIDPFLTGNDLAVHQPDDIKCDAIAFTHAHQDHFNEDGLSIAKANRAVVIAPFELAHHITRQGLDGVKPTNPGGTIDLGFATVSYTPAIHSSSHGGQYMGVACGIVVQMAGKTVYHTGDTTLFSDMKLLGEMYSPDAVLVPIGGAFTMDAPIASRAVDMIGAPLAIPHHYKTFPALAQDASGFEPRHAKVHLMDPAQTLDL